MRPREAAARIGSKVSVFSDLSDLYGFDQNSPDAADILVLEGALATPELLEAFSDSSWAAELVEGLPLPDGHHWLFTGRPGEDKDDTMLAPGDLDLIVAASGLTSAPSGNVRCTWWIRRYDAQHLSDGDASFFTRMLATGGHNCPIGDALVAALQSLLTRAAAAGGAFLVEQVTVVLAKDASRRLRTLTPKLHADEYYGRRQTAISSLTEAGWSRRGGALFLPERRMADLDRLGSFDLDRIDSELASEVVITPQSGDVMIYDGMRSTDGAVDRHLGVPHISADVPGQSARLVVLMRHIGPSGPR